MGSPFMNLTIPVAGVTSGPVWAQNISNDLNIVDAHNHTLGSGQQIPTAGLNINTNLSFQGSAATNLEAVIFVLQSSFTTRQSLYVAGAGELFYNDAAGNAVKITSGGAVNATSSGISSGNSSAAFASGVLQVYANNTTSPPTPANILAASILLGNNSANSNFVTLSPPNSLTSSWSVVLPALPSGTSFVTLDTSGNLVGSILISRGLTQANLSSSAGITGGQIASSTVSGSNLVSNISLPGNPGVSSIGQVATGPNTGISPLLQWAVINSSSSVIAGSGSITVTSGWSTGAIHISFVASSSGIPAVLANSQGSGRAVAITTINAGSAVLQSSSGTNDNITVLVVGQGQ